MKLYAAPLNFRPIAREFGVRTQFSPELHRAASQLEDRFSQSRIDARSVPLVTIDPAGSKDLDQAVHIEKRAGGGYVVRYAIADVAAFVAPGSPVAEESLERGQTIYLPDEPARLHPEELSEGSASLLPDVDRPAVLWTFELDEDGEVDAAHVERALVRSVARLDYEGVHADLEPIGDFERDPVAIAERLLGRPHALGARSSIETDCSGLVQQALLACGLPGPRRSDGQAALGRAVEGAERQADGAAALFERVLVHGADAQAGGLGVFDPGINALSVLTAILPDAVRLRGAELSFPSNRETPIAARLDLVTASGAEIDADFDWRQTGPQTWDITVETDDGTLELTGGGVDYASSASAMSS